MEKLFKLILGLLFLIAGIYLVVMWKSDVWFLIQLLFKGGIGLLLAFVGFIIFAIGLSELKG